MRKFSAKFAKRNVVIYYYVLTTFNWADVEKQVSLDIVLQLFILYVQSKSLLKKKIN